MTRFFGLTAPVNSGAPEQRPNGRRGTGRSKRGFSLVLLSGALSLALSFLSLAGAAPKTDASKPPRAKADASGEKARKPTRKGKATTEAIKPSKPLTGAQSRPRVSPNSPAERQGDAAAGKSRPSALPPPDTSKPPPLLPQASREKMHECAEEWAKLKMETRGPLPMWRDFANKCLKR